MRTIYLHLGYHKTGTTFLQGFIFPKLKNVNYIKWKYLEKTFVQLRLRKLSDLKIENIRDYINSFNNRQPMLISYEGLSGSPFAPTKTKKQSSILEDLRRVFPASDYNVHVIIGVREQLSLFTSLYIEHLHHGGVLSPQEYIDYCAHNRYLYNLDFYEYLNHIERLFGEDHLYLMVHEHFTRNSSEELLRLLNYMGETKIPKYKQSTNMRKINKSFGASQVAVARKLNKFFKTPIHPQGWLPIVKAPKIGKLSPRKLLQNKLSYKIHYKKYKMPESLQESIKEPFIESNRKLEQKYNLGLPESYFKTQLK